MTGQWDPYWECEKCGMTLAKLAASDEIMYESSIQSWLCLRCSELKPKYVKILRKHRQEPERRMVERSKNPQQ